MISKRAIKKVAEEIVNHFHPQKVILFGSHAYGTPTEDSDVDLLVIMDAEERKRFDNPQWQAVVAARKPDDQQEQVQGR